MIQLLHVRTVDFATSQMRSESDFLSEVAILIFFVRDHWKKPKDSTKRHFCAFFMKKKATEIAQNIQIASFPPENLASRFL